MAESADDSLSARKYAQSRLTFCSAMALGGGCQWLRKQWLSWNRTDVEVGQRVQYLYLGCFCQVHMELRPLLWNQGNITIHVVRKATEVSQNLESEKIQNEGNHHQNNQTTMQSSQPRRCCCWSSMFKLSRKGADQKTVRVGLCSSHGCPKLSYHVYQRLLCVIFSALSCSRFANIYDCVGWTWNLVSSYHAAAIAKGSESRQTRIVVPGIYCKQKALNYPKPKVSPYRWCLLSAPNAMPLLWWVIHRSKLVIYEARYFHKIYLFKKTT